ncbi:hypothetical protein INR49_001537 [Caranx melampygus]|nr:hypothetical protein INR49_001537 [Caranx melampygus]
MGVSEVTCRVHLNYHYDPLWTRTAVCVAHGSAATDPQGEQRSEQSLLFDFQKALFKGVTKPPAKH